MAGLPGVGKSAVADELGARLGAAVLSVDLVESAMHRAGLAAGYERGMAAYLVAEELGHQLLGSGQSVIIDAVNEDEGARQGWRRLAERHEVALRPIEVVCGDVALHRRRLEGRRPRYPGVAEPTWAEVEARRSGLEAWTGDRLVLDTVDPLDLLVERATAWLGSDLDTG